MPRRLFTSHTSWRRSQAFLALLIVCLFLAFVWAISYKTRGPMGNTYIINIRALALLPFLAVLAASSSPLWRNRALYSFACVAILLGSGFTLMGVWHLSQTYTQDTAQWRKALPLIAAGARFNAWSQEIFSGQSTSPLLLGIPAMAIERSINRTNFMFLGDQLPLSLAPSCPGGDLGSKLVDFAQGLAGSAQFKTLSTALWAETDAALVHRLDIDTWRDPYPHEAVEWARGPHWRLWGPPAACFPDDEKNDVDLVRLSSFVGHKIASKISSTF